MHDAAALVVGVVARRARAVFAPQREVNVAPGRVVFADGLALGVVAHDALRIGDVDAEIQRLFFQPPDRGPHGTAPVGFDAFGEAPAGEPASEQVIAREFGEQVGGVDHHVLDRIAHPRFDLGDEDAQQEPAGQADDQEIAEENARPELHGAVARA